MSDSEEHIAAAAAGGILPERAQRAPAFEEEDWSGLDGPTTTETDQMEHIFRVFLGLSATNPA